jgi:hypothetical protein
MLTEHDINNLMCLKEGFSGKFTDQLKKTENGNRDITKNYHITK